MKISKEVWLVIAVLGFGLAFLIDKIAGPVAIVVGKPTAFLTSTVILTKFPLTATAVIIRSLAIFISVMLVLNIVEKNYFSKAIFVFFVGVLAEFYAIQQLANGFRMTTIQWTLSIAYAAALLSIGILGLLLKGIWQMFNKEDENIKEDNDSILVPPNN